MCSFSAGEGRSGTFFPVDITLDQINAEQTVDIKCTVKMGDKGMYMIQTAARELAFHRLVLTHSYHTVSFCTSFYPSEEEEVAIVSSTTSVEEPELEAVLSGEDIITLNQIVRRVSAADNVVQYAVKLARATRPKSKDAPDFIQQWVRWGAGPRAGQYLILGAKARGILRGRVNASIEDVKSVAHAVLRHRVLTNFHAEAEGVDSDTVITRLLDTVQEPAIRM